MKLYPVLFAVLLAASSNALPVKIWKRDDGNNMTREIFNLGLEAWNGTAWNGTSTIFPSAPSPFSGSKTSTYVNLMPETYSMIQLEQGANRLDYTVTANRYVQIVLQTMYDHQVWAASGFQGNTYYFPECSCSVATTFCSKICTLSTTTTYAFSVLYRQSAAYSYSDYTTYYLSLDASKPAPPPNNYPSTTTSTSTDSTTGSYVPSSSTSGSSSGIDSKAATIGGAVSSAVVLFAAAVAAYKKRKSSRRA